MTTLFRPTPTHLFHCNIYKETSSNSMTDPRLIDARGYFSFASLIGEWYGGYCQGPRGQIKMFKIQFKPGSTQRVVRFWTQIMVIK